MAYTTPYTPYICWVDDTVPRWWLKQCKQNLIKLSKGWKPIDSCVLKQDDCPSSRFVLVLFPELFFVALFSSFILSLPLSPNSISQSHGDGSQLMKLHLRIIYNAHTCTHMDVERQPDVDPLGCKRQNVMQSSSIDTRRHTKLPRPTGCLYWLYRRVRESWARRNFWKPGRLGPDWDQNHRLDGRFVVIIATGCRGKRCNLIVCIKVESAEHSIASYFSSRLHLKMGGDMCTVERHFLNM